MKTPEFFNSSISSVISAAYAAKVEAERAAARGFYARSIDFERLQAYEAAADEAWSSACKAGKELSDTVFDIAGLTYALGNLEEAIDAGQAGRSVEHRLTARSARLAAAHYTAEALLAEAQIFAADAAHWAECAKALA